MSIFFNNRSNSPVIRSAKNIDALIKELGSKDPNVRRSASNTLVKIGEPAFDPLFKALDDKNDLVHEGSAKILGKFGESAIPEFVENIINGEDRVREGAAIALGEIGEPALDHIFNILQNDDPTVRRAAAIALGNFGGNKEFAIELLVDMLHDPDSDVQFQVAEALEKQSWSPKNHRDLAYLYIAKKDWDKLGSLNKAAVAAISDVIDKGDATNRIQMVKALGKIRDESAVDVLIPLLKDDDDVIRAAVVATLGELSNPALKNHLVDALSDNSVYVRMEAAWSLDKLRWNPASHAEKARQLVAKMQWKDVLQMGSPAIPELINALKEEHAGMRFGAMGTLLKMGPAGETALHKALESGDRRLQISARQALNVIKKRQNEEKKQQDEFRKKQIEEELKDNFSIEEAQEELHIAQKKLKQHELEEKRKKLEVFKQKRLGIKKKQDEFRKKKEALRKKQDELRAKSGKKTEVFSEKKEELRKSRKWSPYVPPEKTNMDLEPADIIPKGHQIPDIEKYPCDGSGSLQEDTFEKILNSLKHPDKTIRSFAVHELTAYGERGYHYILNVMTDPQPEVRSSAAQALGTFKDPGSIPILIKALRDDNEIVRIAALQSLGLFGGIVAANKIIGMFSDGDPDVRAAASETLGNMGVVAFKPVVEKLDDSDQFIRLLAVETLGRIGITDAIVPLIDLLDDEDVDVRVGVRDALKQIGMPVIIPLIKIAEEGNTVLRVEALQVLAAFDDLKSREIIIKASKDSNEVVRRKASELLKVGNRALNEKMLSYYIPGEEELELATGFTGTKANDVDYLITSLNSEVRNDQVNATKSLLNIGEPALKSLIRASASKDEKISFAANEIIGKFGDKVLKPAVHLLKDPDIDVQCSAVRILAKVKGKKRSLNLLIAVLEGGYDSRVRATAAESLGYLGDADVGAINVLITALDDPEECVSLAAAGSLEYLNYGHGFGQIVRSFKKFLSKKKE